MIRHSVFRRLPLFVAFSLSLGVLAAAAQVAPQGQKPIVSQPAKPQVDTDTPLARADDFLRKGSFDQAIAGYNEVLKSDPQSGAAYAGIVRSYLKQDNVHNAAEWLAKGLQTNSEDPRLKESSR
jgi:Tfp pilus assembly protein PilF